MSLLTQAVPQTDSYYTLFEKVWKTLKNNME